MSPESDPSRGKAHTLYLLGKRTCPECRGDLKAAGDSSLACPACETAYKVGGGVP